MLKKNLKNIEKKKNKTEKDKKEPAKRLRVLPMSRQVENVNENKKQKKLLGVTNQNFLSKKTSLFQFKENSRYYRKNSK